MRIVGIEAAMSSMANGDSEICPLVTLPPSGKVSSMQLDSSTGAQRSAAANFTILFFFMVCNLL